MIPPHNSLVKYDNAILVSTTKASTGAGGGNKQTTQTEDILNSILPPREWTEVSPRIERQAERRKKLQADARCPRAICNRSGQ